MKNQLLTVLHEILHSFDSGFFLHPAYEKEYENFLKLKYPWKYERKLHDEDFEHWFTLETDEEPGETNDFFNIPETYQSEPVTGETKYIYKPEFPDLNRFIYFWYKNPEKTDDHFEKMIFQKMERFEKIIQTVIPEHQKSIIQILLPKIKLIGGNDLFFLKGYFKFLNEETFEKYFNDMVQTGERAARSIEHHITEYYFNLILKTDSRQIVSRLEYVAIMAGLGHLNRTVKYETQAKTLIEYIENHEVFEHIKLPVPKNEINLNTIEEYIKQYFSENKERFEGVKEKVSDIIRKMKGSK